VVPLSLTLWPCLFGGFSLLVGLVLYVAYRRQGTHLGDLQRSLAESQDHFRLVFEHSGVGMALLTPEGYFLQANPALVQLFGYDAKQLAGRRLIDLAHPKELVTGSSSTELGLKVPSNPYERVRCYRRKDGREVWARVLRVPLRDAEGQLRYIVAVLLDITERRRAEMARTAAEQRYRNERDFIAQVLETADALVIVLDASGRIMRFNGKCLAISGLKKEELKGRLFWEALVPERSRVAVQDSFAKALCQDHAIGLESAVVSGSSEERLVSWRISTIKTGSGQARYAIAAGLDITDQRKLEDQLQHAQKMETLGTLVGGIAHDFNNQLAIIIGNIGLVLQDMSPVSPGRSELIDAEQASQRCADMTRTLLTFGRRQVGRLSAVNLNEVLSESVRLLGRVMPANVAIHTVFEKQLYPVNADRTQLHQVLMNLAVNARDAMPKGGILTLSTANQILDEDDCAGRADWRPGRYAVLSAVDTGSGMTREVIPRIFEPFFTTKKLGQGTGLGLAMVFGIVKAHSGWISVDSMPGKGSSFKIYLPEANISKTEMDAADYENLAPGQGEHILVVDDELLVRKMASTILERWGFDVATAASGEEALDYYRQHGDTVDLVLLDIAMPGLNGMEVLEQLRELNSRVRVVLASGHSMQSDFNQLIQAGCQAFVAKPYRAEQLVATIRQVLGEEPHAGALLDESNQWSAVSGP